MAGFRLSNAAARDLRRIGTYTKDMWGAEQAKAYSRSLRMALAKLAVSPKAGRRRDELAKGLRSFRIGNHIAYYLEAGNGIMVVRILHPSMDAEKQFKQE